MKHKARFLVTAITILAILLSLSVPAFAGTQDTIPVSVGGQQLNQDAIEKENTIFLPLRAVCESLGYTVEWAKADRSVTVKTGEKNVLFELKTGMITDNGHSYYVHRDYLSSAYIGTGCMLIGDRIYAAFDIMESCFGLAKSFNEEQGAFVISVSPKGTAAFENKKIYAEDQKLLTKIQYPHLSLADTAAEEKINAVILADVDTAQKQMQDNLKEYGEYGSPNRFELNFNYRIVYQKGDLLSIVLNDYQYYGGAHGGDRQISHTFDLKTGTEYSLEDLMMSDSGYRDYINKCIKADIMKSDLADAQLVKFETISENQNYYLSGEGLVVYFQQYEYFPYAAGIVEFTLPYTDLPEYLKPGLIF